MSKNTEQLQRQLKGQIMTREKSDEVAPMVELLKRAKTAVAKATVNSNGDFLHDHRRNKIAGINGTISLRDLLPDLQDQDGRVYSVPNATNAGSSESLSLTLARNSRVIEAGTILMPFPVTGETVVAGNVMGTREEPSEFITIEPALIDSLTLDGNGEGTVNATAIPAKSAKLDRNALTQRAVRFSVPRSTQKAKSDSELSAHIMQSLALGLGKAVDEELLNKINAITLSGFSLANAATMGVKFEELRGIVGKNAIGATTEQGNLLANGIPAEFSSTIASTVIGAFNRSAVAISDEITLLIERTNVNGTMDVTAWVDMQALVPNAAKYFLAGA